MNSLMDSILFYIISLAQMCYCHNGCCCQFRVRYPIIAIFLVALFSVFFFPLWYSGYVPARLWNTNSVETECLIINNNVAPNAYSCCSCGKKRGIEEDPLIDDINDIDDIDDIDEETLVKKRYESVPHYYAHPPPCHQVCSTCYTYTVTIEVLFDVPQVVNGTNELVPYMQTILLDDSDQSQSNAQSIAGNYPNATNTTCYYNQNNPYDVRLKLYETSGFYDSAIVMSVLIGATFLAYSIYEFVRWRRRYEPQERTVNLCCLGTKEDNYLIY